MATTQTSAEPMARKDDSNAILKNGSDLSMESTPNDCYSRVKSPVIAMSELHREAVDTHQNTPNADQNSYQNYNSNYSEDAYRNSHLPEPPVGQHYSTQQPPQHPQHPQHHTNYQNSSDIQTSSGQTGGPPTPQTGPQTPHNQQMKPQLQPQQHPSGPPLSAGPGSGWPPSGPPGPPLPNMTNANDNSAGPNAGPPVSVGSIQSSDALKSKMSYMQQSTHPGPHLPPAGLQPPPMHGPTPGSVHGQHGPHSGPHSAQSLQPLHAAQHHSQHPYPQQPQYHSPHPQQYPQQTNQMYNRNIGGYHQPLGPPNGPPGMPGMGPPVRAPNSAVNYNNSNINVNNNSNSNMTQNNSNANNGTNSSVRYPGQPVSGPTPTLNQLLQSPNTLQRYQNSYSDYSSGGPQTPNKEHNLTQPQQQAWNAMRFNQQQQQQQQQQIPYRNQESNLHLDESSNSSGRSTPGKPTTPGPPQAGQVRMSNHQSHAGMSPGYGNNTAPNNAYNYGNHQQYGVNNNMMPPPTCYPTKNTIPATGANGAQVAAQAALIAAERSAGFTVRSPHSSMYLRQHLQQRMYAPNSPYPPHGPPPMSPMGPSGPLMHGPTGPMHGLPPNEPIPPTGSEAPPHSGYPMPPSHMTSPPTLESNSSAATSVTQSITSPLSATPSLSNSIAEVRAGPQPPPILDEASQASTTSSQAEDSSDIPTPKHNSKPPGLSHPPTPNTLGSPGAASLSSFHDEFESVSSPSWPRTPASPVVNSQGYDSHSGHNVKRPDGLMKLYDMSDEPERKAFLDKLIQFQDERGTPISQCPTISKLPLDLFRLYMAVKERGGFLEVTRAKLWKECTQICNIATSSSAAYTLRKQYMKHLLPFECKFDRGGVDPQPILASLDSSNRKKNKNAVPPPEPPFQGHTGPPNMDGYPPGAYPPQPFPPPNAMSNSEYPPQPPSHQPPSGYPLHPSGPPPHMTGPNQQSMQSLANHNESISVKDPFADDIQHGSGYQSRSHPQQPSQPPGPQTGSTPPQPSNEFNIAAQPSAQPNPPPPQNHFGEYNEPFNRQTGQTDPYTGPPPQSQGYPPNRMSHPSYYNQQQSYDSHRTDSRFEPHNRPPSQDPMYGQQPPQPPASAGGHQPRGQYPIGAPSGQPSTPHPPNTPPSSTPNYTRGGSSPIGQQFAGMGQQMGQQMAYNNTTQDNYKSNDMSGYQNAMLRIQSPLAQRLLAAKISQSSQNYSGSQQPLYSSASSAQPLGGMPAQKTGPTTGANTTQPPIQTQTGTTWHPQPANQFGQKRHPDFMKQEQHYPPVNNTYGSAQPSIPPTGQFPPYSGSGVQNRQTPPNPPSGQPLWNRDNQYRAYGPSVSHMPPNPTAPPFGGPPPGPQVRENWEHMSRVDNGPNWPHNRFNPSQNVPPHELYSGPTPYGGGHQINKMSNFSPRTDQRQPFMSNIPTPNKMPPHMMGQHHQPIGPVQYSQQPHHPVFHQIKKEIIFPPDSVEATTPIMSKRRRLCSRDLSSVEAWRLIMCLKSGLLAESTWALDILSVLLHDDSTVLYFGLQHMPGMLEVLLEHYKRYLTEIFGGLLDDTEVGFDSKPVNTEKTNGLIDSNIRTKLWFELNKDLSDSDSEVEDENEDRCTTPKKCDIPSEDQLVLLNTTNFTFKSRNGKPVKIKNAKSLFIDDPDKNWDLMKNGFTGGVDHWTAGGGESTAHIQTHFESDENYCRFVRVFKKNRKRNRNSSFSWKMSTEDKNLLKTSNGLLASDVIKQLDSRNNLLIKTENNIEIKVENSESIDNNVINSSDKESTKSEEKDLEFPRIRDSDLERFNKRKDREEYEDESYDMDEPAVQVGQDYQDSLTRRCLCLSTLIRNLSFVPGNDENMSKHSGLLLVMSRLLLLHHSHVSKKRNFERSIEEELFASEDREKNEKIVEKEWWWDVLHTIRENTLVTIANLSGQLDLSPYPEQISLPFLDGLLHWAVCPASYAQDTLPFANYYLSPQRLAFEALSKLSILDSNVDLMLATPPWSRIDKLYQNLSRSLSRHEDQTIREFSVVLLSNLSSADSSSARAIALTGCAIPLLISFVEQAEQSALQVANAQGINALRENPELMGTTLDMVRRSASTLRCLSRVPDNRQLFVQFQQRLLALVMSQILDQGVAGIVADVIYECSLAKDINCETIDENNEQNQNQNHCNSNEKEKNDNIVNNECNESNESFGDDNTENNSSNSAEPTAEPEANGEVMDAEADETQTSTDSNSTANT